MATLFETMKKRLGEQPVEVQQSNQAAAQKVLAAKSGKAGVTGPASNIGEQVVGDQIQGAIGQQTLAGRIQGQELANAATQQQQKFDTASQKLAQDRSLAEAELGTRAAVAREGMATKGQMAAEQRNFRLSANIDEINNNAKNQLKKLMTERGITVNNLFADFKRSNQELEARKDAAKLEQRAFQIAMADKEYLEQLRRVGEERRLRKKAYYQDEAARLVMGEELNRYITKLGFDEKMADKNRGWERELAQMGFNVQLDLARAAIKDENNRAIFTGVGQTAAGVADYYMEKDKKENG